MFGETTVFYIKIWNHPIETTSRQGSLNDLGLFKVIPPVRFWDFSVSGIVTDRFTRISSFFVAQELGLFKVSFFCRP